MGETLRAALRSLLANRLRSLLTTIGIVIGVAAVILLVALGTGMKTHFNEQFSRLANQITITSSSGLGAGGHHNLTDQDVTALADPHRAPHVLSVSPSMSATVTLTVGQTKAKASLVGATQSYLELTNRKLAAGTWLRPDADTGKQRQAVMGRKAMNQLWGAVDPHQVVGQNIRIDRTLFEVVGILDSNGQSDNVAIVPFAASRAYLVGNNSGQVDQIVVKATSADTVAQANQEVTTVLDQRHFIREVNQRDFTVSTYTDLLDQSTQFINFLTVFIVAIAAISLLVGGIGVANIMLVSVTERTREIGIRKAVGATRAAILRQFLSEAVVLTGLGGAVGVALGITAALTGGGLLTKASAGFPAPILTPAPVVIAFGVSLAIGLLAGGYPAFRAARMRPIEALRFE
jgi:ABC-type antimicrobial peptide transport system permease subunit